MRTAAWLFVGVFAAVSIGVGSDFELLSVDAPDTVLVDSTFTPAALIQAAVPNLAETTLVRMTIGTTYDDTVVAVIPAGQTQEVSFASWQPQQSGTFTARCSLLTPDIDSTNDAGTKQVRVREPGGGPGGPPEVEWERTFQSVDTMVWNVAVTADHDYVVSGFVDDRSATEYQLDYYVLRLDSAGGTVWERTYGAPGHNGGCVARPTADGGFILTGGTGYLGVVLLKVDSMGNQEWQYDWPVRGSLFDSRQTAEGGYVSACLVRDSIWLLRVSPAGQPLWTRRYDSGLTRAWSGLHTSVFQTSDEGFVICLEDLLKTDSLGNPLWRRSYDRVRAILDAIESDDGDLVATGFGHTLDDPPQENACLLKISPQGSLRWMQLYPGEDDNGSCGLGVAQTSDGGYFISGETGRGYVIRTDSLGGLLWTRTVSTENYPAQSGRQTPDGGFIVAVRRTVVKLAPEGY